MVKVVARNAASFVGKLPPETALVLIFGADRGQVSELAAKTVQAVAEDINDPFRVAELTLAAIGDDPALLNDEAQANSMGRCLNRGTLLGSPHLLGI